MKRFSMSLVLGLILLFSLSIIALADQTTNLSTSTYNSNWTYCSAEKQYCTFSGQKEVRYGESERYNYKILTNGTNCSNTVFGDPIVGTFKHCYIRDVDKTAPTTTDNAPAGWINKDVTVALSASDSGSGVDVTYYTVDSGTQQSGTSVNITTEGTHTLTYWSVDKAGNVEAKHSATVRIDKLAPTITGAPTTIVNAAGWYNDNVTVHFDCSDAGSGVASCTQDITVATEGTDQNAPGTATDIAGNSATTIVKGINIDKTVPTTTDDAPTNWVNKDVKVTLTPSDSGSGVAATYYTVDGGSQQTGTSVDITTEGAHTLTYWSVDKAGNAEIAHSANIQIDKTVPTITGAPTTSANANGWYNGNVTVHFDCTDSGSGVASCSQDTVVTTEGANQSVQGTAIDNVGNTAIATVNGIKIDTTAPTTIDNAPTGWVNKDVTVALTASDSGSGVANTYYTVDGGSQQTGTSVDITTEGAHTLTYWSLDKAGNAETPHSVTIQIDKTVPTITGAPTTSANANGWYNGSVTVHFDCTDSGSGVASCSQDSAVTTEGANQSVQGSATDVAGNSVTTTVKGINIDKTVPTTTDNAPTNWVNKAVTVTLTPSDSGSGVAATYYIVDGGSQQTGTSVNITTDGTHTLTYWSVDKARNVEVQHTATIQVDKTAPTIKVVLDKTSLWPPNHKLETVTATVFAGDSISQIGSVVLTSIKSNEPDNGLGDGDQPNDIQGADYGTLDTSFMLRAERSGRGTGRIYTITYTATDKAGNKTSASATVIVN